MSPNLICSLIIREAPNEASAKEFVNKFKDCPYIAFLTCYSNKVFIISFVPKGHWWWIEKWVEERRRVYKEKVTLFKMNELGFPKNFNLRIPVERGELAPCGTNCKMCEFFTKCACCPATIYYKGIDFYEKVR